MELPSLTEIIPRNQTPAQVQLPRSSQSGREDPLRTAAEALEAGFLAQMLEAAGLGEVPDAFGGGEGESQFSSFLRQEQAKALVENGGIGLAEAIYASLVEQANE